jgi:phytoene dehydrogenase-like protein
LLNISQLYTRPALRASPYRTSQAGLYLCSSATPPGGGVHGMCGYYAARRALRDVFHLSASPLHGQALSC